MRFKSVFSRMVISLILFSCQELARDNPLDPKNPDSQTSSVVLLEAFVNTVVTPVQYNVWSLEAGEAIQEEFSSDVILVQYHRDILQADDPYNNFSDHLAEQFDALQRDYVDFMGGAPRGVPDIFINGVADRISGASSEQTVKDRLKGAIQNFLNEKNRFLIQPEVTMNGQSLHVTCRVVALGNREAGPLLLKIIFLKDFGQANFRHVAIGLVSDIRINKIEAGSYWEKSIGDFTLSEESNAVVFSLTDENGLQHYQSRRVFLQ